MKIRIEEFPPQVFLQRSLVVILMKGIGLKEFPSVIGDLSDLEGLEIIGYELRSLLPSFGYLKNLKILCISTLYWIKFPFEFKEFMPRLQKLTIS